MIDGNEMISVREQIVRSDGSETVQRIHARFDGADYPVEASPIIDTMAYIRTDNNTISAIGKKNDAVMLTETVSADRETGTLSLTYEFRSGGQMLAHGVAVFVQDLA